MLLGLSSSPLLSVSIWSITYPETLAIDTEWKYVNVRRLCLFLEQSILRGTQWMIFEPNDRSLWNITRNISAFLRVQWHEGKLVSDKEDETFFAKCDESANPSAPESVAI